MTDEKLQIVVLIRGYVYIGFTRIDGEWLYMRDALNLRTWGTSKGLGEIAQGGPTKHTVLDMGGHLKAPLSSVVFSMDADPIAWQKTWPQPKQQR